MMCPVRDPGDERPVDEDGTHEGEVVEVCPPGVRIVDRELESRFDIRTETVEDRRHGGRHRSEMDGDVFGLGEHLSFGIEECRRAVGALLDVG